MDEAHGRVDHPRLVQSRQFNLPLQFPVSFLQFMMPVGLQAEIDHQPHSSKGGKSVRITDLEIG